MLSYSRLVLRADLQVSLEVKTKLVFVQLNCTKLREERIR